VIDAFLLRFETRDRSGSACLLPRLRVALPHCPPLEPRKPAPADVQGTPFLPWQDNRCRPASFASSPHLFAEQGRNLASGKFFRRTGLSFINVQTRLLGLCKYHNQQDMIQSPIEEMFDPCSHHTGSFQGTEEMSPVGQPDQASARAWTACPASTKGVELEAC
jgi:hypothetical protein